MLFGRVDQLKESVEKKGFSTSANDLGAQKNSNVENNKVSTTVVVKSDAEDHGAREAALKSWAMD